MRHARAPRDAAAAVAPSDGRNNWSVVIAAAVCTAMGSFDLFGVNVVLPRIAEQFGIDPSLSQWIVTAYILPITALALPMGRWMDRVGRRSSILFLVGGFCAASLLIGVSASAWMLIAARIVQGVFGAGVFSSTTVLAFEAVRPQLRNRAVALNGAVAPLGAIAGPSLGALLANAFGWRSIFLTNLGAGVIVLAVFALTMRRDAPLRWPDGSVLRETGLMGTAIALVLVALTLGPAESPWWFALALAALPLVTLWWRTNRTAPFARLLRIPGQPFALGSVAVFSATGIAMQYLFSYFAAQDLRLSVVDTGLALIPLSAASAVTGPLGGFLADRFSPVAVAVAGLAVSALGMLTFTPLHSSWGILDLAWRAAVFGVGQGLMTGPAIAFAMGFAPSDMLASSSAALQFVRNFGFVAGPVAATAGWAASGFSTGGIALDLWAGAALTAVSAALLVAAGRKRRAA